MTLVVIGKNSQSLDPWVGKHSDECSEVILFPNVNSRPLAEIANHLLDHSLDDVVGFCHADVDFGPGALQAFEESARAGKISGIVGRVPGKGNRWCHNVQDIPGPVWSLVPGPVSTLDSCSVFFRRDLGLRFDPIAFDGCHCWVEDFCLQASRNKIPIEVPFAIASHRGDSTFNLEWQSQHQIYRRKLDVKYPQLRFETT